LRGLLFMRTQRSLRSI